MSIRAFFTGLTMAIALAWTPASLAQAPDEGDRVIPAPGPPTPEQIAEDEAREAADREYAARYNTLIKLRLGDNLTPEQRARITEVLDTLPSVRVAENATHELIQHPVLEDVVVLVETTGGGLMERSSLWSALDADRNLTLEQRFEFFAGEDAAENAWASSFTPPVEIGDIADPLFSDRLHSHLLTIARHAAFLTLAAGNTNRTISVCLANEPPPSGFCPLPRRGVRWNQVWHNDPIHISVESTDSPADIFTIIAISRDGAVIPIASGKGVRYALNQPQIIGEDAPASPASEEVRLFFSPDLTLNDRLVPGHYDLVVITTQEPIPPSLWSMPLSGTVVQEACPQAHRFGLCFAMQGQRRESVSTYGSSDIHLVSIGVRTPVESVVRLVKGRSASASVSLWQAQLLRYRPVESRDSAGRRVFNFKGSHSCGGAYIGDGFVLTAAHCIPRDTSEMRVRLGSRNIRSGGRAFKVRSLVVHKRGNVREERVDLAVLQLNATKAALATLGDNLKAVELSIAPKANFNTFSRLTVTGWGFQRPRLPGETGWLTADGSTQSNPDYLEELLLDEATKTNCTDRVEFRAYQPEDMLCLRAREAGGSPCAGDSGGPVTGIMGGGRRLVGIVSSSVGCATNDVPAVYVNVAQQTGWIERAKRKLRDSAPDFYEMD